MGNKFNIFIVCFIVILAVFFGYTSFKINQELEKVKSDYALKNQVSDIVLQKIDGCIRVQVTKSKWNFNSDDIYARDVCKAQSKSCFTATMIAMEGSNSPFNAFSKGNFGCNMPLSKNMLQDDSQRGTTSEAGLFDSYEVVCC